MAKFHFEGDDHNPFLPEELRLIIMPAPTPPPDICVKPCCCREEKDPDVDDTD